MAKSSGSEADAGFAPSLRMGWFCLRSMRPAALATRSWRSSKSSRPYIVEAELGRTAVTDASFDTLKQFTHLRALHLGGDSCYRRWLGEACATLAIDLSESEWDASNGRGRSSAEFNEESSPRLSLQHACPTRPRCGTGTTYREEYAMNPKQTRTENGVIDRRSFCAVTGVAALATLAIPRAKAATAVPGAEETTMKVQTGNGEWTYKSFRAGDSCLRALHSGARTVPLQPTRTDMCM